MNADMYADILPSVSAVVHTIGTLLDNTKASRQFHDKDFVGLFKTLTGITPTEAHRLGAYERLNRDTGEFPRDVSGALFTYRTSHSYV